MNTELQQTYRNVMETFVERVRQDSHILAVFVGGSLSYDEVWEKSDIDVYMVCDDEKRPYAAFHLVEQGICISTNVVSRAEFRKTFERVIQTSSLHSYLYKSTLVYCKDEAVRELYEQLRYVGDRDRSIQLLQLGAVAIVQLEKAEKWIAVKRDAAYSFIWMMDVVRSLAQIEVVMHRDIPTREVIHQALKYNPVFFEAMYTELVHGPKNESIMQHAVRQADAYLMERKDTVFHLIFDYLAGESDVRPFSELMLHMKQKHRMEDGLLVHATEWLAEKGYIFKASSPVRLTPKSRVEVDELAYFDGRMHGDA
ncbi:hypothetical protein [Paenibacillus mendelii]|uniref:Polymerase beta nucleotidyltransferase domain-containing protein n=1 Tax=Paenibacillus mendelii TaxID=206163 RepID=A0ABV6J422_9BACL|nr:hypothetical protein [Paenibacillus mendelii]MCQ6562021.1 hypothetical protein [Paenibacillus mendelii]